MIYYYNDGKTTIKGTCQYKHCARLGNHVEPMEYTIYPALYHADCYLHKQQDDEKDSCMKFACSVIGSLMAIVIYLTVLFIWFPHMLPMSSSQHVHTSG